MNNKELEQNKTFDQGVIKRLSLQLSDYAVKNAELAQVVESLDLINKELESKVKSLEEENAELQSKLNSEMPTTVSTTVPEIIEGGN